MRLPRICRAGPLSESMGHHMSKGGCAHTCRHTYMHTYTHTCIHTHARTTHTHTHKHTHIQHTPEQCTQVCILAVNINKQFSTANVPRPQVSVWPNSGQRPHPRCQHQHFPRVQLPTGCRQVSSDGQICDNSAMLADYQTTGHFLVHPCLQ